MIGGGTYRVQRRAVQGQLDELDRRVVARLDGGVGWERDLGQADGAWVGVLGGADDLEGRDHGVAHVGRPMEVVVEIRPFVAEAQVDEDEGRGVALEPARLESDGAAGRGPEGAVGCCGHAAAWWVSVGGFGNGRAGRERGLTRIHPLHAVGECFSCLQVVASPPRICDDCVCGRQCRAGDGEKC